MQCALGSSGYAGSVLRRVSGGGKHFAEVLLYPLEGRRRSGVARFFGVGEIALDKLVEVKLPARNTTR